MNRTTRDEIMRCCKDEHEQDERTRSLPGRSPRSYDGTHPNPDHTQTLQVQMHVTARCSHK
jgi:hypothetical protein